MHRSKPAVVIFAFALMACESAPLPTVNGAAAWRSVAPPHSRRDTPWADFSDDQLTARVIQADGRVFIGFKDAAEQSGVDETGHLLASSEAKIRGRAALAKVGAAIEFVPQETPYVVARVPANAVQGLRHNPWIEYIEPIASVFHTSSQDTTWNIRRIGAVEGWSHWDGTGVVVQVIDTGVDPSTELNPAVIQSCIGDNGYFSTSAHGTITSSIIAAANNATGIIGVAPGVSLWSSKVGNNPLAIDPAKIACAVNFGRLFGARVMNISLNGDTAYTALTDEINAAYSTNNVVVVASAGNTNGGPVQYPATLSSVIAVSAVDQTNTFASFSAQGSKIELTAPGTTVTGSVGLTGICPGGGACALTTEGTVQGTSLAAPHVAGAAAILAGYNTSWSNSEIRRRLTFGALPLGPAGRDAQYGYGMVSLIGALSVAPTDGSGIPSHYALIVHGPISAKPGNNCYWYASTSIQNPMFEWSIDGQVVGGGTFELSYTVNTTVELRVRAWNAEGAYQVAAITVDVSSENERCFVE